MQAIDEKVDGIKSRVKKIDVKKAIVNGLAFVGGVAIVGGTAFAIGKHVNVGKVAEVVADKAPEVAKGVETAAEAAI